jgi:hypothetical protein
MTECLLGSIESSSAMRLLVHIRFIHVLPALPACPNPQLRLLKKHLDNLNVCTVHY